MKKITPVFATWGCQRLAVIDSGCATSLIGKQALPEHYVHRYTISRPVSPLIHDTANSEISSDHIIIMPVRFWHQQSGCFSIAWVSSRIIPTNTPLLLEQNFVGWTASNPKDNILSKYYTQSANPKFFKVNRDQKVPVIYDWALTRQELEEYDLLNPPVWVLSEFEKRYYNNLLICPETRTGIVWMDNTFRPDNVTTPYVRITPDTPKFDRERAYMVYDSNGIEMVNKDAHGAKYKPKVHKELFAEVKPVIQKLKGDDPSDIESDSAKSSGTDNAKEIAEKLEIQVKRKKYETLGHHQLKNVNRKIRRKVKQLAMLADIIQSQPVHNPGLDFDDTYYFWPCAFFCNTFRAESDDFMDNVEEAKDSEPENEVPESEPEITSGSSMEETSPIKPDTKEDVTNTKIYPALRLRKKTKYRKSELDNDQIMRCHKLFGHARGKTLSKIISTHGSHASERACKDVCETCRSCKLCKIMISKKHMKKEDKSDKSNKNPLDHVSIDLLFIKKVTIKKKIVNLYAMTILDEVIGYLETATTLTKSADVIKAKFIEFWTSRWGIPKTVKMDNGTNLIY